MNKRENHEDSSWMNTETAMKTYNLGRASITKYAKEAGAFFKIGRSVRIDRALMDDFFLMKNGQGASEFSDDEKVKLKTYKMSDRKDSRGDELRVGEQERKDGYYIFRYRVGGNVKSFTAKTLDELREKESCIGITHAKDNSISPINQCRYILTQTILKDVDEFVKNYEFETKKELGLYKEFAKFFKEKLPDTYRMMWEDFLKK